MKVSEEFGWRKLAPNCGNCKHLLYPSLMCVYTEFRTEINAWCLYHRFRVEEEKWQRN